MEQVDGHKFPRSTKLKGGAVDEDAPRTAELEDALRLNLEQLQKWLAEQEQRELQQIAEVEHLFQELVDPSGPRGDSSAETAKEPMAILPGGPGMSDADTRHGTDDLHLQDIDDINEAAGSCKSAQGFCRVQSQSLAQWAHRKDARWDKARDRLQKQLAEKRREGRRKSDAEVPELRPQMSHYVPMEDEGSIFRRTFLLFENSEKYVVGTLISAMMVTTIIISTVTFVMESMPEFQERSPKCQQLLAAGEPLTAEACEPVPMAFFGPIEAVCIAVFTIEYLVRICTSCTEPKFGSSGCVRAACYASTTLNLIDLAAIVPFYVGIMLGSESVGAVRILRLMRVLRLLKLAKHHPGITLCVEATVESGVPLAVLMCLCLQLECLRLCVSCVSR